MSKKSNFFSALSPHIEYASIFDRELDRRVAHKFNVFDFLDKKEIGLSQIIAHLLNPSASHGQGTLFLQHFLKLVKNDGNWDHLNSKNVKVGTEHSTANNRRMDIHVASWGEEPFRLAIENKPYAGDPKNQVLDYLKDLKKKPGDFLLVYISPNGKGPSERSLPREKLSKWEEKFKVMAYAKSEYDQDEFQRVNEPLTTWFKICKEECEVDRLRWFLGDAENFCTKTFGDSNSIDDVEVLTVNKFLRENKNYLNTAYAVNKAWPNVVNKIAGEFLEFLAKSIEERISVEFPESDIKVSYESDFNGNKNICMRLYSENWFQYQNPKKSNDTNGRDSIVFTNEDKNKLHTWYVGIETPKEKTCMERNEKRRFNRIRQRLNEEIPENLLGNHYSDPVYKYSEGNQQEWERLLEKLSIETEQGNGGISDYYVNFIWEFADTAIGILDEIENHP